VVVHHDGGPSRCPSVMCCSGGGRSCSTAGLVSRSASAATELRRITQLRKGGGAGSRGQVTCAGRTIDRAEGMDQRVGGRPASPRSCPRRLDVDDRGRDRSAPNPVVEEGETPAGQSRRACEQAAPCLRRGMPVSRDRERPSGRTRSAAMDDEQQRDSQTIQCRECFGTRTTRLPLRSNPRAHAPARRRSGLARRDTRTRRRRG